MRNLAWTLALLMGVLPPCEADAAGTAVEYEGTAQLRTAGDLTVRLHNGELLIVPSSMIGRLDVSGWPSHLDSARRL